MQAFDALWLEDCLNDVYDAVDEDNRDDKIALLYEINKENKVAINTAVGQTERIAINQIVAQGSTWGSLLCSNHIDSIGRRCSNTGDHTYKYKDQVEVLPLAMVDDLLGIANCGHNSLALNTFINTQVELKKLKFHTPDANGKSKCNVMHVGQDKGICPKLKVHGTDMKLITHDKYLGDIIASDGKADLNIESRVGKGLGLVTDITNMLDKVTLGSHYFKTAMLLRESKFLNGILTNAETWFSLSPQHISQLESVDKLLLRSILGTPVSTPTEAMFLELGIISIGTIIKARRINFLHYLATRGASTMVSKVFMLQWNSPCKDDWVFQVRSDLKDFKIEENLAAIQIKSEGQFKDIVRAKAREYEFSRLMKMKSKHESKMGLLNYSKLDMKDYLLLENFDKQTAQTVFRYRTRMANYGKTFVDPAGLLHVHFAASIWIARLWLSTTVLT